MRTKHLTNILQPQFNINVASMRNMVLREASPVDTFYHEELELEKGRITTFVQDPLVELLNQERLERTLGTDTFNSWLKAMDTLKNNPFEELRKHCTDAELIATMKSRYIQQPCEMLAWAKLMSDDLESFKNEVSLQREKQLESTKQVEQATTSVAQTE